MRCSEGVHARFLPIPFYLVAFYEGIGEGSNTKEMLRVLARASDERLDIFNKLLVFWWFWSGDRIMNLNACSLNNSEVQEGLRSIWGISDDARTEFTRMFDAAPQYNAEVRKGAEKYIGNISDDVSWAGVGALKVLWKFICSKNVLDDNSLDSLFVLPHLDNAQMGTLKKLWALSIGVSP